MSVQLLLAKPITEQIYADLKNRYPSKSPTLAVILVGNDPASLHYINHKKNALESIGGRLRLLHFSESTEQETITKSIHQANNDSSIDGIIVQLPLPSHLNRNVILNTIDPQKDADCLSNINLGKVMQSNVKTIPQRIPATPHGIMLLLEYYQIDLESKHIVMVGDGILTGRPLSNLLLTQKATVTICNKYTQNIEHFTNHADILISAVGQARMFNKDHIKSGAVLIDVGISLDSEGKIAGDFDFDSVVPKASAITPVPGGVGPLTVACLIKNLY